MWEEKDPKAEVRAEGAENRNLHTCWQEREDGAEKLRRSWLKKKKNKNEVAPKYLHFLLPTFDILIVFVHFYFLLEVTEKD